MNLSELLYTEGVNSEFKLELPQKDIAFLKTCVAFANGRGGRFVFGIRNEDHAVLGMNDDTLFQDMDTITNIVSDNCEPAIMPNVYPVTVQGKSLIIVEIAIGRQRPYYVKSLGMIEGTYIRVAAETRKAEDYMVKELMFEGAHRFFDKTVCLGLEASEADLEALCAAMHDKAVAYQAAQGGNKPIRAITRNQLLSWGILTRYEDKIVPTNAFALLTGHYLLPSMVQCAVFKGVTKDIFIDKREYEGPIQDQQEEAYQFVLRNIKLGARISGLYRQDIYEIPPDVIRELLVNAVLHRSYLAGGNIQVALYENRLEVFSPGKLPMEQSIEAMKSGFSKIRNEALAKAFAYMGLIEGWGSGIPRINSLLLEAGLKELEISGGDFYLKFVIYRNLDFNPMTDTKRNFGGDVVGHVGGSVGGSAGSVGGPAGDVVGPAGDVVGHVGGPAGDVVGPAGGDVVGHVGGPAGDIGGSAGDIGGPAGDIGGSAGGDVVGHVGGSAGDVGGSAGDVGGSAGDVGDVVGPAGDVVGDVVGDVGGFVVGKQGKEALLLQLLKESPNMSARELATRLHVTSRTAERILKQLKQCGKIERIGNVRSGCWIVKEENGEKHRN